MDDHDVDGYFGNLNDRKHIIILDDSTMLSQIVYKGLWQQRIQIPLAYRPNRRDQAEDPFERLDSAVYQAVWSY